MTIVQTFDPGFAKSATAVVESAGNRLNLLHFALIQTNPKQSDPEREHAIWSALSAPMRKFHPTLFGIEDQAGVNAFARVLGNKIAAAKARGVKPPKGAGFNANNDNVTGAVFLAKGCCIAYGVPYTMLHPKKIKTAVCGQGAGSASKEQVIAAVRVRFPELVDVKLSEHEADAIAAAVLTLRVGSLRVAS